VDLIIEFVTGYEIKALVLSVVNGTHSFVTLRNMEYLFVAYLIDAFPETMCISPTKSFDGEILSTVDDHNLKDAHLFKDLYLKVGAYVFEEIDCIINKFAITELF